MAYLFMVVGPAFTLLYQLVTQPGTTSTSIRTAFLMKLPEEVRPRALSPVGNLPRRTSASCAVSHDSPLPKGSQRRGRKNASSAKHALGIWVLSPHLSQPQPSNPPSRLCALETELIWSAEAVILMRFGSVWGRRKPQIACATCSVSIDIQLDIGQGVLLALETVLSTADERSYRFTADNIFPIIELNDTVLEEARAVLVPVVIVCQSAVSVHQRHDGVFVFQPVKATLKVGDDLFRHSLEA